MDTLLSAAHLRRELGEERFAAIVSSDNTAAVRELADKLIAQKWAALLPMQMTVAGRTYDILSFLRNGEVSVVGHTMIDRARRMSAHLGRDDGEHILQHQDQIPVSFRGKVVFVFTDWCNSSSVNIVEWGGTRWCKGWQDLDEHRHDRDRVLRRK